MRENIKQEFLLSDRLTEKYARIIFLCDRRLDTHKKRLNLCTFTDFDYCASVLMSSWTDPSHPTMELVCISHRTHMCMRDVLARRSQDPHLTDDIRDVRSMLSDSDTLKAYNAQVVKHVSKGGLVRPCCGVFVGTCTPSPPTAGWQGGGADAALQQSRPSPSRDCRVAVAAKGVS